MFCTYTFNDLAESQNLWSYESTFPKSVLIFPENFFQFQVWYSRETGHINLCSHCSKSRASVFLIDSEVTFLGKGRMQPFIHFSIVFCLIAMTDSVVALKNVLPLLSTLTTSDYIKYIFDIISHNMGKCPVEQKQWKDICNRYLEEGFMYNKH